MWLLRDWTSSRPVQKALVSNGIVTERDLIRLSAAVAYGFKKSDGTGLTEEELGQAALLFLTHGHPGGEAKGPWLCEMAEGIQGEARTQGLEIHYAQGVEEAERLYCRPPVTCEAHKRVRGKIARLMVQHNGFPSEESALVALEELAQAWLAEIEGLGDAVEERTDAIVAEATEDANA